MKIEQDWNNQQKQDRLSLDCLNRLEIIILLDMKLLYYLESIIIVLITLRFHSF